MTLNTSRRAIFQGIREIIADELDIGLPKLDAEVRFEDICDYLETDLPAIIIEVERAFGVDISDAELDDLETVEELVDLVEEKIIESRDI